MILKLKTRTSDEIQKLAAKPNLSLPKVLACTTQITDLNIEILQVYPLKIRGRRPIRFKHLCCFPAREDIKDIEFIRGRILKKISTCRKCYIPINSGGQRYLIPDMKKPLSPSKYKYLLTKWKKGVTPNLLTISRK